MNTSNTTSNTTLPPVMPGTFTLPPYDGEPPQLLGGYCPRCQCHYFPAPQFCKTCLEPPETASVGSRGTVYSFTVIRKKAPLGLPLPYCVGYIDLLETGLRVFCLLDAGAADELQIGTPVKLAVDAIGNDAHGNPCLRPYFTPMTVEEQ